MTKANTTLSIDRNRGKRGRCRTVAHTRCRRNWAVPSTCPQNRAAAKSESDVCRAAVCAAWLSIDRWGNTPFSDAIRGGHVAVAEYLFAKLKQQGVTPSTGRHQPRRGETIRHSEPAGAMRGANDTLESRQTPGQRNKKR